MRKESHSEEYERARSAFDDLKLEDRAVFLIEATVSTIARGVDKVGRVLADELDRLFRTRPGAAEEGAAASSAQEASNPPSEERRPGDTPGVDTHVET